MLKSRPLLLLVVTLCLVVVALISFWLAALPKRMLFDLQHSLDAQQSLLLEADNPQLSLANGLSLQLDNVSITGKPEGPISLSAQSMQVGTSFAALFGDSISVQEIVLSKADISVDVVKPIEFSLPAANTIKIMDSTLRLRDDTNLSVVALSDVNGEFSGSADGAAKIKTTFLFGGALSTFTADIENSSRLSTDGSPVDIVLSSKDMVVAFSGQAKLTKGLELAGQSSIEAGNTAALLRWLGMPLSTLEGVGEIALQSGTSMHGLSVSFEKATGNIGTASVQGSLNVAAGADRMKLAGVLDVSRISAFGPKVDGTMLAKPWSEQVLPLADAKAIDYDLQIKVTALALRGRELGPLTFNISTDGDKTSLNLEPQALANGKIAASLALEGSSKHPTVSGTMKAEGVDAQRFLGGFFGFEAISGAIDIDADLKTEGVHTAALVSSLKGEVKLQGTNLTIHGVDLLKVISKPGEGWTDGSTSALQVVVPTTINEGVVSIGTSDVKSANIALKPKGEIDLLRQTFELQLLPKGKGADAKITLTGLWTKPVFSNTITVKEKSNPTPPAN